MRPRWPHQEYAFTETVRYIDGSGRSCCVTSPTGGGKSRMMTDLIDWATERNWKTVLYTPRRMLTEQLISVLESHGIDFGVRAAGFKDYQRLNNPVQISSPLTEKARVYDKKVWRLHPANLVLIDEKHMQKADVIQQIQRDHTEAGAAIVSYTATPLGISDQCDKLIVAGTNSELRKCGAHLKCFVYAPDEPDLRGLKRQKTGEFSYNDIIKHVWSSVIFGRVLEHWKRLNPDRRPAILFAPGVKESVWFVQEFEKAGVAAAHIDGDDVYYNGESYPTSPELRKEIIEKVRTGEISVICNRFVMREGIDIPELYHCILATPIGSLLSYIQTVGRILRNHPSLDHVIVQDHGGNWHRHGSPNQDRNWNELWTLPVTAATDLREERMRNKEEPQPICCPKCGAIRLKGDTCVTCGFRHDKSVRMVIQKDGLLKAVEGDVVKQRRVLQRENTEKLWSDMYWRMKRSGKNFRQAEGFFFSEYGYYPPHTLPLMPTNNGDWHRSIKDVPFNRLTAKVRHEKTEQPAATERSLFE